MVFVATFGLLAGLTNQDRLTNLYTGTIRPELSHRKSWKKQKPNRSTLSSDIMKLNNTFTRLKVVAAMNPLNPLNPAPQAVPEVAPVVQPAAVPSNSPAPPSPGTNNTVLNTQQVTQTTAPLPTAPITSPITVSRGVTKLPTISIPVSNLANLDSAAKKDLAMQLVSSAENSSLNWTAQYGYIEDIGDGRGYTGGIIGFTSGTHDMLELVRYYTKTKPGNVLAQYLPALVSVDGTDSHAGLGAAFESDWKKAAADTVFQQAQNEERDRSYFNPAARQAKADGLKALGQFIYYDAIVMHGPGEDPVSFGGIRATALKKAKTPTQGGDEVIYLHAFLDARAAAMRTEAAHQNVDRVETAQRVFLRAGNLDLAPPLKWSMYGDHFLINQ